LNKVLGFVILLIISSCSTETKQYNFVEDVAPIIFENCSSCHHKGGAAPFAMVKYHDVAKRAKMIAHVTSSGYMPPWPADTDYSHFIGEKTLSEKEITILNDWYLHGVAPGDTLGFANYNFVDVIRQGIGEPDLVLKMNKPFFIPGDNKDRFMVAKFPFTIASDTNIRLVEFVPDNKQLVHHVNAHLLTYQETKDSHLLQVPFVNSEDHTDSSAFYALNIPYENGGFPILNPSIANYLPGVEPFIYPEGIGGARISKQSALLVKDFHFGPSPKDDWDDSYFNIYFDKEKPKRPLKELIIGTQGVSPVSPPLLIAPNIVKEFGSEYTLPEAISVLTLNPHMHLIGKEFKAFAVLPLGDTIPLIKIKDWNFRWQYFYTFPQIIHLPKGTIIKVEALFDNTLNNMDNPFNPPQFIMGRNGSMKTTDEMLQLIITYLPYQIGDELIKLDSNE
tara:strand:+ start:21795 stop:23138 length:1344 start_codon:yes stop_codon:yes gene_type:complete